MNTIRSVSAPVGFAIVLDGAGGIRSTLDLAAAPWSPAPEPSVIVLSSEDARGAAWMAENVALAPADRDAVLGPIRRTWAASFDEGGERVAALLLEGTPHVGEPIREAMGTRAIVSRARLILLGDLTKPTPMIDRLREAWRAGKGPRTPADALIDLTRHWTDHYLSEVMDLDRVTATLGDKTFSGRGREEIEALNAVRRTSALLRRRVASHRAAIVALAGLEGTELVDAHADRWRGLLHQSDDLVEVLDGLIEREQAVDDHLQNQFSTELSDRLYVLTLVSATLLPLSFITGLLGVNIGGIPLRESRWAFWILCTFLVVMAVGQYWVVKKLRWLPRQDYRLRRRRSG